MHLQRLWQRALAAMCREHDHLVPAIERAIDQDRGAGMAFRPVAANDMSEA
jgi:hypothetical protein